MRAPTMQTTAELDEARNHYRNRVIPPGKLELMDRATRELVASGIKTLALKAGNYVDDFTLTDPHGKPVRLQNLLEMGPVVISFLSRVDGAPTATSS